MPNEIVVAMSRMICGVRSLDRFVRHVEAHGHVAAADVEADAGDADLLFVGDHATDRLCIAEVSVRADDAGHDVAGRHAVAHLRDGCCIVLAEDGQRCVLILRRLRTQVGDLDRGALRFARQMLFARGIAIETPRRLAAACADPRFRVDACGDTQFTRALLIGISSLHGRSRSIDPEEAMAVRTSSREETGRPEDRARGWA